MAFGFVSGLVVKAVFAVVIVGFAEALITSFGKDCADIIACLDAEDFV